MKLEPDPVNPVHNPTAAAKSQRQRTLALAMLSTVLVVLVALLWHARRSPVPPAPVVREFTVFDSYARITLWAPADRAEPALQECAQELAELHRTLNRFDPTSEIARLNAAAAKEAVAGSPLLWDVLQAARRAYLQTDGAFDISVGPLMAVWGFHRKRDTLPSDTDIEAALARVGLPRVQFDDAARTVHFTVDGMSLDCGGIAKGYALGRVMAILARHRIEPALVDLGGNVGCTALPPPGRPHFVVGVRNPFATETLLGRLPIRGRSVSTSGNYERRIIIQKKEIGHIIEPRTGRPVSALAGVTAVTPQGVDSDVFSTAVYVAGRGLAETLVRQVPGTGFVLVSGTPEAPELICIGDLSLLDDHTVPAAPVAASPSP
jgi:thiamine biosynthesis lipoprotein